MVSAEFFDHLDKNAKIQRSCNKPFGGLQVLYFQFSPPFGTLAGVGTLTSILVDSMRRFSTTTTRGWGRQAYQVLLWSRQLERFHSKKFRFTPSASASRPNFCWHSEPGARRGNNLGRHHYFAFQCFAPSQLWSRAHSPLHTRQRGGKLQQLEVGELRY